MRPPSTRDESHGPVPPLGGRWLLGDRLGGGAEGVVFAAVPVEGDGAAAGVVAGAEGAALAVKITWVKSDLGELRRYLDLQHRNLATYRDFGILPPDLWREFGLPRGPQPHEQLLWIVMSRASGSLAERIDESEDGAARPLPAQDAIRLWRHLSGALAYLAEQRIVHGDVKPGNVLGFVTPGGIDWRLADFGMSIELGPDRSTRTRLGHTPAYQSPEARRSGKVSPADDVYAAALTTHVAATGRFPRRVDGKVILDPRLPKELRAEVSQALRDPGRKVRGLHAERGSTVADSRSTRRRRRLRGVATFLATAAAVIGFLLIRPTDESPDRALEGDVTSPTTSGSERSATTTTTSEERKPSTTSVSRPTFTPEAPTETVIRIEREEGSASTVYFSRATEDGYDLIRLDVATGREKRMAADRSDLRDFALSGDGMFAAVADAEGSSSLVVGEVGSKQSTTYDVPGNATSPALSPDGTRVAFVSDAGGDADVLVIELRTRKLSIVAGGGEDETVPSWRDDTYLGYIKEGSSDLHPGSDEIWSVSIASSSTSATTVPPGSPTTMVDPGFSDATLLDNSSGQKSSIVFSPDGAYVLFVKTVDGDSDVVARGLGGLADRVLASTPEDETGVAWCKDGLVTSAPRRGLVLVPHDGSGSSELTSNDEDARPICLE